MRTSDLALGGREGKKEGGRGTERGEREGRREGEEEGGGREGMRRRKSEAMKEREGVIPLSVFNLLPTSLAAISLGHSATIVSRWSVTSAFTTASISYRTMTSSLHHR